jgi:hypothetical protein
MGEGGEVRQVDAAVPPRRRAFPKLWINLAAGIFGGLVLGVAGAFSSAYLSPRVREPRDVELSAGVPAVTLDPRKPLLLAGLDSVQTLLVLPVGGRARAGVAARRIAMAASARGKRVVLADLEESEPRPRAALEPASSGTAIVPLVSSALLPATSPEPGGYLLYRAVQEAEPQNAREALDELEQHFSLVVVALPGLEHPAAEALLAEGRSVVLVGYPGVLLREELREVVAGFARAGIRTAGVVLQNGEGGRHGARRA